MIDGLLIVKRKEKVAIRTAQSKNFLEAYVDEILFPWKKFPSQHRVQRLVTQTIEQDNRVCRLENGAVIWTFAKTLMTGNNTIQSHVA